MKTIEHLGERLVAAVAFGAICVTPALAQKTTFNPSLSVGVGYTNNLNYAGEVTEDSGDVSAGLGVRLPLNRGLRNGSVNLSYFGKISLYQTNSDVDNVSHRLHLNYSHRTRRGSQFRASARYVRTQEQFDSVLLPEGIKPDDPLIGPGDDVDLSVTERTNRETASVVISYGWRLGPRWGLGAALNAGRSNFEGGEDVENRKGYGGSLNLSTDLSRRSQLELGYSYTWVQLEESGDEQIQQGSLTYRQQLSRTLRLDTRLGAFAVRSVETGESDTGTFGAIGVQFNDGLVAGPLRFGFSAGASPSGGGALIGSALNTSVGASMSGVRVKPLNWGLYATYTYRKPFDSTLATSYSTVLRASVEHTLRRWWSLRFGTSWVTQRSDDPALVAEYARASLSLVAYPLGGTRLAGI